MAARASLAGPSRLDLGHYRPRGFHPSGRGHQPWETAPLGPGCATWGKTEVSGYGRRLWGHCKYWRPPGLARASQLSAFGFSSWPCQNNVYTLDDRCRLTRAYPGLPLSTRIGAWSDGLPFMTPPVTLPDLKPCPARFRIFEEHPSPPTALLSAPLPGTG